MMLELFLVICSGNTRYFPDSWKVLNDFWSELRNHRQFSCCRVVVTHTAGPFYLWHSPMFWTILLWTFAIIGAVSSASWVLNMISMAQNNWRTGRRISGFAPSLILAPDANN